MARRLRELGARVIEAPVIRIAPLARAGARRSTRLRSDLPDQPQRSRSAVRAAGARGGRTRARWRGRASPRSGRAPRARCASTGSIADVVPERYVAEWLLEALAGVPVRAR